MTSQCETKIKDCIHKKKHVYKERKETTHKEIGENDNNVIIYIYIYIYKMSIMFAITK